MKLQRLLVLLLATAVSAAAQSGTSAIYNKLFEAATATGRSKSVIFAGSLGVTNHQISWQTTGTPTTCTLLLEASEDGATWSTVSTENCAASGTKLLPDASYKYLTANISVLSGGTSPTVSADYRGYFPGQGLPVRVTEGGTGTASAFTTGSVVFVTTGGVYQQDNTNFYFDDANNRLCIQTSAATNCTQALSVGAGKFLVTASGLATIKAGAVVNSDGGGNVRVLRAEVTDAATTIGLQVEGFASQTANLLEILRDGGTLRAKFAKDGALAVAQDAATVSTTTQIDGNRSNNHKITLTENTTLDVVTTGMTAGQTLSLLICQDGTGSRTFAWPSSFKYSFTVTSTASKCDSATWQWDGTNFYGLGTAVQNQ